MLRNITIGQYYPTESVIHRLDPRVKMAGAIVFIVSLFPFDTVLSYVVATVFLVSVIAISRVPVRYILKGLKPVVFLIVFTAFFNIFVNAGEDVIFSVWKITVTYSGIKKAFFMVIRLMYLIVGSSIMTYTTTPNKLTDGIEKSLRLLTLIKVPVHEFALIMSLALRFIPILMEEADRIIKAQSSRGADFEEGSLIERGKNLVSIIIPLLISATRRANDLAMAMDSRCYHGGRGRTRMKPLRYTAKDVVAYLIIAAYLALMIYAGRLDILGRIW